ncbi:MAG: hypothetical protein EPN93_09550 [Spirochaetes bacterium]|nr:MAG: hypothetical protein EPN93_09550 [Spirochaetota bacterium]
MLKGKFLFASMMIAAALAAAGFAYAQAEKMPVSKPAAQGEKSQCVECHRGLNPRLSAPVTDWESSVHAKGGRDCTTCHGGNPSINDAKRSKGKENNFTGKPDRKDITQFCGRDECHATAAGQFKRSPHFDTVKKTGEPGCTTCHGKHNIQRSSANIIDEKLCINCHPAAYSRDLVTSLKGTQKDIEYIESAMEYLDRKKADIKGLGESLSKIKHLFQQMVHVFTTQEIQFTRRIVETQTKTLVDDVDIKTNIIRRLDYIYLFTVVFCFLTTLVIASYTLLMIRRRRKKYREE